MGAMLKVVASSVAAAVVALASAGVAAQPAPKPAPTPFAIGTIEPSGSTPAPFSSPLPDIGRTRSVTPACSAMRDLIVPSFEAAIRADKRFVETRKRLPSYAEAAADPEHRNDVVRQMLLSRLDSDASNLLQEALVVSKALGDPRLSPDSKDPQVIAERQGLQRLYDAQSTRANLINEFVMRERVAVAKDGLEDTGAFASRQSTNTQVVTPPPMPMPALTAPPGMPLRSGIVMADKNSLADWGTSIATYVRTGENQAAKTFIPIAQKCR